MSMNVVAVHAVGLVKDFDTKRAVDSISLTVPAGSFYGIVGPNGAGKTTTIRLLLDLIRPTSGSARMFGLDVKRDSVAIRKRIGYLPAELALWENQT
ncbi:MAG: ATP-binding cassette domain-containing protein, partial [Caldilineaceae bacterium]|nr:ATP-binding cassette domain-containing protein [Caldilineaceae bacterium]